MGLMIDKMRADFALVAATRITGGVWKQGDEAAAGKAIARAIAADDAEAVLTWSRWLAKLALQDLMASADPAKPAEVKRSCSECQHMGKPGRSDGYCSGREDLAHVYGKNHPLHVLPADGGASCARFVGAVR